MAFTARLGEFAATDDIPDPAKTMMRLSLLDWSVCALAGRNEPAALIVGKLAAQDGGSAQSLLVGGGRKLPMRSAALVNGVASHALDYDDTHFAHIGHPSVAVIPAALAVAEQVGASGRQFLEAALIGVEASIRVGIWLGRSHYQAGFHQTATAGAFGATLAAGRLLGLDAGQLAQAIGVVSTKASGLKSQFGTMGKPLNAGIAAANGVEAALLAQAGFISDPQGLEGELGFGDTHSASKDLTALDGIGEHWLFENISHKYHACCHGLHAMLESLGQIAPGIDRRAVSEVRITTHPRWRDVCNIAAPQTGLQAKFSYRLTAALALSGISTAALDSFSDAIATDKVLAELRDRVVVRFDPALPETASQVSLTLNDGTRRSAEHDLNAALPLQKRQRKLLAKAENLVGAVRANSIWDAIQAEFELPEFLETLRDKL